MTCAHGMPTPASCVDCMDDIGIAPPPAPPVEVVFMFTAKFDGRCARCDDLTSPGEPIAKMTDDRYWCATCAQRSAS